MQFGFLEGWLKLMCWLSVAWQRRKSDLPRGDKIAEDIMKEWKAHASDEVDKDYLVVEETKSRLWFLLHFLKNDDYWDKDCH